MVIMFFYLDRSSAVGSRYGGSRYGKGHVTAADRQQYIPPRPADKYTPPALHTS